MKRFILIFMLIASIGVSHIVTLDNGHPLDQKILETENSELIYWHFRSDFRSRIDDGSRGVNPMDISLIYTSDRLRRLADVGGDNYPRLWTDALIWQKIKYEYQKGIR